MLNTRHTQNHHQLRGVPAGKQGNVRCSANSFCFEQFSTSFFCCFSFFFFFKQQCCVNNAARDNGRVQALCRSRLAVRGRDPVVRARGPEGVIQRKRSLIPMGEQVLRFIVAPCRRRRRQISFIRADIYDNPTWHRRTW